MKNLLIIITLFLPLCSSAQTYKCVENAEKVVISEKPCEPGTEWPALDEKKKAEFDLDIAGVKLWMTESQALKVLAATLGISESDIKLAEYLDIETGETQANDNAYSTDAGGYYYAIRVNKDYDNIDNPERIVYFISQGFRKSPLDYQEIKKNLFEKYGEPSDIYPIDSVDSGQIGYEWCPGFELSDENEEACPRKAGAKISFDTKFDLLQLEDLRIPKN